MIEKYRLEPGSHANVVCTAYGCGKRGHYEYPEGLSESAPWFGECGSCHEMQAEIVESFPPGKCETCHAGMD